jgi:hypothetical protein
VIPTFLDLRTGKTAKGDDMSVFWWTEGNGGCDCNRRLAFPDATDPAWIDGYCCGCKRFVAIDVEGDLALSDIDGTQVPHTKEQVLAAMNADYGK